MLAGEQTLPHMPPKRVAAGPTAKGWSTIERRVLVVAALVIGLVGRIAYSWNAPFWFDEYFSGVIATQATWQKLIDWCLAELTGPAFYMPLWLWEKVAGPSNFALRLPSLVLSLLTPVFILWRGHPDRDVRLFWGIFCLLWAPVFAVAGEARPYPQIFALGVAQAILFIRLMEKPTTPRATAWMAAGVALVLTHYWSIIPFVVQGVAYLICHRWRAAVTWPALLVLAPMIGWGSIHLPAVLRITVGSVQAHDGLPITALMEIPAMILGIGFNAAVILGTMLATVALAVRRGEVRMAAPGPALVLALCGIASVAICLWLGFTRPGFTPRYMMASMPALLFAMALWARWMLARDRRPVMIVTALSLMTALGALVSIFTATERDPRHSFNLEEPSAWLSQAAPRRLIVLWDGPVASITKRATIAEVASFHFRRTGQPIAVQVVRASPDEDPNRIIADQLSVRPDSAVLWFANDDLPVDRAPALSRYVPGIGCRDFGRGVVTMVACRPAG